MKPGDHPEFFRFPAPEGRSRESTIVLDERGRFFHEGAPIENENIAHAFASWIDVHPDDGRFILNNGYDWTYLTVLGAPVFVGGIMVRDDELWFELSNGRSEKFSGGPLLEDEEGALWVDVEGGRFRARFTPVAQTALGGYLEQAGSGFALRLGARFVAFQIVPLAPAERV